MTSTGLDIVTDAYKELAVLDPTAVPNGEQITDGIRTANSLLDLWRRERLLVSGITIANYSLATGVQTYTIGVGGLFNQTYPTTIDRWSVIPDGGATDPLEIPMGRPLNSDEWQQIRIKTQTAPYPKYLYYDRSYAAGLGNVLVHPIPDNNNADVKLYTKVPAITELVAGTDYDLVPGFVRALTLNLALALSNRHGSGATVTSLLVEQAAEAKAILKRSNIVPRESSIRPEFALGSGSSRRSHNIYTDA